MGFAETLKHQIKALAFDQYGTVVDMQKGLTEAVRLLEQKG
jgi:2-haloacid dehalogenase